MPVYAFDDTTYTGYNKTTDANGQATFTLPQGDYRFRADKDGEQYWSGASNHCTVPGCTLVTITVGSQATNIPAEGLAFALDEIPTFAEAETLPGPGSDGHHRTARSSGLAALSSVLPESLPAQSSGTVTTTRVITYTYDPLNRLISATYSTGERFEYAYDAVGNRTVMTSTEGVTLYEYDAVNRLTSVGGVPYTWDARGNLTSDGTFTYTYNSAGRMVRAESVTVTLVYTYSADGLRVVQSVQSVTKSVDSFAWDWASGVPEMLSEGDNLYLVGHDTLGRWDGAAWAYHLPDALGSVRQVADGAGSVVSSREWTPFGMEVGAGQAGLGYTGEWWDGDARLLYLRARWYDGQVGRFVRRDPVPGFPKRPHTYHTFAYAFDNPINLTDRSGLAPLIDCTNWPTYLGLKELCKQANSEDDSDPDVLDAREAIFETIMYGGQLLCRKEGVGYCWGSAMLSWFLGASGSNMNITFRSSDEFVNDLGIVRATRGLRDSQTGICTDASFSVCGIEGCKDEPDHVTPLLWAFLQEHVQPVAGDGKFSVGPVPLVGANYYSDEEPRPYHRGFWAAFGHVSIDGTFSAKGKQSCHPEGYIVRYRADYHIEDNYKWFEGTKTPFDFPYSTGVTVYIPHEWELSLVRATPPRARFYRFTISWTERERILVGSDFSWYRSAAWWEGLF